MNFGIGIKIFFVKIVLFFNVPTMPADLSGGGGTRQV
jgi:hypothetical protein